MQRAVERDDALLHAEESHAGCWRQVSTCRLTVVFDTQDALGVPCLEAQLHMPGLRMLCRIGDRLLRDAIETCADAWGQIVDLAKDDNDKAWRHAEFFIVREIPDHEDQ